MDWIGLENAFIILNNNCCDHDHKMKTIMIFKVLDILFL
ncbi:hypothetical protein XBKB1_1080004 [Xenorhabdus bovienii str. kraussei Becker Underwood]|uniref:Uncharacterized protein n=1 Tax=Xenorhabdus bovienii str. kraussei Becker Underwood TaxID=1398204 RepID=A0A077PNQ0_XENBV|nr:hypothetical protein XBKB1_1080004 [Xenorhabdus bovienii str. kraussei Becker Underwood]